MKSIKQFDIIPVDPLTPTTFLNGYKSPNDKILSMEKS